MIVHWPITFYNLMPNYLVGPSVLDFAVSLDITVHKVTKTNLDMAYSTPNREVS